VVVPPYLPDHPLIREDLARYYDEITRFDEHVGLVLRELERQGELDQTFVVYLSDNGMPFPRAKTTLYDSGIRTPLIVRYPAFVPAGSVQSGLVSSIDIAPTILALAGIEQDTMSGQSLMPMLKDPLLAGREAIFAEANWHDFETFTRAVRTERFLLIRNYYWDQPLWNSVDSINSPTWTGYLEARRSGTLTPAQRHLLVEPRPFEELYDLQLDPMSLANVVHDPSYTESLNRLRTHLDNWRVETADTMPEERREDGWTRDGRPLPHNQPWYDRWLKEGKSDFDKF
jgi:arylsulfatase A-like enzyme